MRGLAVATALISVTFLGCRNDAPENCGTATFCTTGTGSYHFCTATDLSICGYITSDGKKFECNSCRDCQGAAAAVTNWCAPNIVHVPDMSTHVDAGTGDTCGAATTCPTGGRTYQFCTTGGTANCRYVGTGNAVFTCTTCQNCSTAATQVATWCGGSTGGTDDSACVATGDWADCSNCCATNHDSGANSFGTAWNECECTSPGACSSECAATFCVGTTEDATCTTCINTSLASGGQCAGIFSTCQADTDCTAYLTCLNSCPRN